MLLVVLFIVKDIVEVLDQLLLASNTIDLTPWNHVEDVIYIVTVSMLIIAYIRLLVKVVRATNDAVSVES